MGALGPSSIASRAPEGVPMCQSLSCIPIEMSALKDEQNRHNARGRSQDSAVLKQRDPTHGHGRG